jgi:hypothetical protein
MLYYPPFGLASTAFMGISAFIISSSIYSTALIISFDKTLQLYLTKSGSFLGNIGSAQMYQSINKRIAVINEKMVDFNSNYNILTQNDVQNYLEMAIKEKEKRVTELAKHSLGYSREEKPFGKSWNNWIELWWKWCYHDINGPSPAEDLTGILYNKNQIYDPVWFLAGTFGGTVKRICSIPYGKSFFFPILNDIISFATDPHLKTENELYEYAKDDLDQTTYVYLKIDGKDVSNLLINRINSGLFTIYLKLHPIENSNIGHSVLTKAISDGYWVFLKPLSRGRHIIEFGGEKLEYDQLVSNNSIKEVPKFKVEVLYEIDIV